MFLVLVGIFYENSWHGLLLRFWLLQFPAGEGFNCTRDRVHRWFSRASCSAPDRVPALRSLPDKASLRNFGNRPGRCRAISRHPAPESPEGPSHAQTAPGRSPLPCCSRSAASGEPPPRLRCIYAPARPTTYGRSASGDPTPPGGTRANSRPESGRDRQKFLQPPDGTVLPHWILLRYGRIQFRPHPLYGSNRDSSRVVIRRSTRAPARSDAPGHRDGSARAVTGSSRPLHAIPSSAPLLRGQTSRRW